MAKNPLDGDGSASTAKPKRTPEECCRIGNEKLSGPYLSADGKTERTEGDNTYRARLGLPPVKWVVINNTPTLVEANIPESSLGKKIP